MIGLWRMLSSTFHFAASRGQLGVIDWKQECTGMLLYMGLAATPLPPTSAFASAAVRALVCCELASGHDLSFEVVQL